jgi:WD40 repeat protein
VLVSDGREARLRDAWTGEPVGKALYHGPGGCTSALFGPDGKQVVTLGGASDPARLWTLADGRWTGVVLELPKRESGEVPALAFRPDGKVLLTATRTECRLWDTATGAAQGPAVRYEFKGRSLQRLCAYFDPKGKPVVVGAARDQTRLLDATTGKELRTAGHGGETLLALSPDGRVWLRDAGRELVRAWDADKEQPLGDAFKADGKVFAFSADGTLLLTTDGNRATRLTLLPGPVPGPVEAVRVWLEVAAGVSAGPGSMPGTEAEPKVLDGTEWQKRRGRLAEQLSKE